MEGHTAGGECGVVNPGQLLPQTSKAAFSHRAVGELWGHLRSRVGS